MITITKVGDNYVIETYTRPPSIYLDHCAIRRISENPQHRRKFLGSFSNHGTLHLSWMHVLELSKTLGISATHISRFLEKIGSEWFLIDINPIRVGVREEQGSACGSPCFAKEFIEAYIPHIHRGPLSLRTMVDLAHAEEVRIAAEKSGQALKDELCEYLMLARKKWRASSSIRKTAFVGRLDPSRPARYVFNQLMKQVAKEDFPIEPNDAVDLLHTIVPLAYCDMIVLNGHWADLVRKMGHQCGLGRAYPVNQLETFLSEFEEICRRLG